MAKENSDDMGSSLAKAVESHVIGFAAEESRLTGKTINMEEFFKNQLQQIEDQEY